jgi:hypothetical protein
MTGPRSSILFALRNPRPTTGLISSYVYVSAGALE